MQDCSVVNLIVHIHFIYIDSGALQSSYGQSDDTDPYRRSFLLAILVALSFKSPDVYAVELHSIHQSFIPQRWSTFVGKVGQNIRDSNLLVFRASVCLISTPLHANIFRS